MPPTPRSGTRAAPPPAGTQPPPTTPPPATPPPATPPALPTAKTVTGGGLSEKMVTIYGPPGVGKSTLASEWAGGGGFFFNCAGELGEFEVFQQSITSWAEFREYAWAIADSVKKEPGRFPCGIIDTADALGRYCSETVRKRLAIAHESEAEFGKGWQALRDEFAVNIAKLAAQPNFGVLFVAHADERTVQTRSSEFNKWQIRGVKSIRETMLDMSDLVLFVDYSSGGEEDEFRVIKTKPTRYWDAKERGPKPRLPAEIVWPIGTNGWELIKSEWEKGGKS